ncbi:MAG: class I adenylate-forming enzyme family protein [Dehalococcoidia bacterium]
MNVAALLHNAARTFGARPAVSMGDEHRLTYAELQTRAVRLAGGLMTQAGLTRGDRVAIVMSNTPVYFEVLFAIWHAGLAAVPVNAKLHPKEVAFVLENCRAAACFVTEDLANAVTTAVVDTARSTKIICVDRPEYARLMSDPMPQAGADRDDLAWLFYTSGTTGRPKGAMLTHQNLQLMAWSYLCDFDQLTERDSMLHLGPLSHAAGLLGLSHIARGSNNVLPPSGGFDVAEIATLVDRLQSVTFFAAPTMLRRLVESPAIHGCRIEHIRSILGGAAPFYADDVRRALATFGPRFTNGYGQGECPCTITAMPKHFLSADLVEARLTSVGVARTGVELRIADGEDRDVPVGETGEILVRSDIVMRGYWENPAATAQTLAGGWLHTGDLGSLDAQGFLSLKDRSKDVIISGGSNIYPREVEDVLLTDPDVAEVAVVGHPDPEWGESIVAFVVARCGRTPDGARLDRLCLDNLARFKRPKRYVFIQALPRNSTGKVMKTELRHRLIESGI